MEKLLELKNQRAEYLDAAEKALNSGDMQTYENKMEDVQKLNQDIVSLQNLEAEKGRFTDENKTLITIYQQQQQQKAEAQNMRKLDAARSGNEYANAWAKAIKNKIPVGAGFQDEAMRPLYNAMTIGGGDPEGSEGGFLVPIEFDNMIHRKMKDFVRLADFFNVENVTGLLGWRAVETSANRVSLPEIDEAAIIPEKEKPKFKKITYTIKKYGDRIAVSSELMNDNTAGLMQYIADWFAPRVVITENELLLKLLNGLTPKSLSAGKEVADLKSVLNKSLNTAYSKSATILGNQSSYDFLDQLTDKNGRGLMTPDPSQPDVYKFKNRPVIMADDDLIPNRTVTASGAAKGDYYPLYIGNLKAFGTLFRRQALEFASTAIGGQAWETATSEIRGIVRMDAQLVDEDAAVLREIFVPAT